jgi:hypothetical protein
MNQKILQLDKYSSKNQKCLQESIFIKIYHSTTVLSHAFWANYKFGRIIIIIYFTLKFDHSRQTTLGFYECFFNGRQALGEAHQLSMLQFGK